jgi:hypothetical protein
MLFQQKVRISMFFLELFFYFFMAFIAIYTWERIKLKITIPIYLHIRLILFHLLATLCMAILCILLAFLFNFPYIVVGLFTTLISIFSWFHFESFFSREVI